MTNDVLILTGDGINCENETRVCCETVGLNSTVMQVNDLLENPKLLHDYYALIIPGGFSFGDDLGSGKIFARKLKKHLSSELAKFITDRKLVLGICNGFQVLATLGLFNCEDFAVSLNENKQGHFINRWEEVVFEVSHCLWTKNIQTMRLPIRHAEGRLVFSKKLALSADEQCQVMKDRKQIVLTYRHDPNGSFANIAGLCDETGQVFGLMPHPEAARHRLLYPGHDVKENETLGMAIFENMKHYIKETF